MNPIEEITYGIVRELQERNRSERIEPVNVSMLDIQKRLNEMAKNALNGFIKDKTMKWYPNLNGIPMFAIIDLGEK